MNTNFESHIIRFQLAISTVEYLAYYQGRIKDIQVRTSDNRTIRFPAGAIQKFLTHDGIFGTFEIQYDEENKLTEIKLVSP